MKRLFLFLLIPLFIILLIAFKNIGDVRPALFPSRQGNDSTKGQTSKTVESLPYFSLQRGFQIRMFSDATPGARDLTFSPGGTLLVSLTGNGSIVALPDNNHDKKADEVKEILSGLARPHGIAFHNGKLFVAEEQRVAKYYWDEKTLTARFDKELFSLPFSLGGHFTRSIVFDKSGKLFVSIGSTCNVCRELDPFYASIIVSDENGKTPKLFVKGLRNAVFLVVNPNSGGIWATEMGRDFLGDDLPPDEIDVIEEGKDYGWPLCFGNKIHDVRFDPSGSSQTCEKIQPPLYEIQAHSAPLGLTFVRSKQFPSDWQGDLLVAYHGSWNRSAPTGYKVVRFNVRDEKIIGEEDFVTGFIQENSTFGRPVDLEFDNSGNLYVSDDKRGAVYVVDSP